MTLPSLAAGAVSLRDTSGSECGDSAKTIGDVKKTLTLPAEWTEGTYDGRKFLFALAELPTDSESYIDVHGWIYNEYYQEWRRFLVARTRNLGQAKLFLDTQKGVVSVRGAANNDLNQADALRFDLRATSNDAAYRKLRRA